MHEWNCDCDWLSSVVVVHLPLVSGTYFLPGPVGPAFFNDPCTMVVLGWRLIWREFVCRWQQEKDEDEFCKVALPAARSDSGLSVSFFGGVARGKIAYRLIWITCVMGLGHVFSAPKYTTTHLAKEYNFGDEEDEINGDKTG